MSDVPTYRAVPVCKLEHSTKWHVDDSQMKTQPPNCWGIITVHDHPVGGMFFDKEEDAIRAAKALDNAFALGRRFQQRKIQKVLGF